MRQKNKYEFYFNSREYLKNAIKLFSWKKVTIHWDDLEIELTRDTGFQVEGGGMIIPLSPSKMIYKTLSNRDIIIPTSSNSSLYELLNNIECNNTSKIDIRKLGIREKFKSVYRRFSSAFNFYANK